jgi:uncharacterized protein (TIGR02266 family)
VGEIYSISRVSSSPFPESVFYVASGALLIYICISKKSHRGSIQRDVGSSGKDGKVAVGNPHGTPAASVEEEHGNSAEIEAVQRMENTQKYNLATEETYQDGQTIFKEGSWGDWVYVILSGSVEISKVVQGEKYVLDVLQSGEVFGELGFIGGMKRTATARAIGETTLGILDREFFEKEYNLLSPQFRRVLEIITDRFKKMLERAKEFSAREELRVPKVLSLVFKDRQSFIRAYTGDVSSGGLFIKTETPLGVGHQFLLKLQLPGVQDPLQVKCEVVWSRKRESSEPNKPPGMGIKFCEISKSDLQILKKYVSTAESG